MKVKVIKCCGGFEQAGALIHAEGCVRGRTQLTGRRMASFLASVEQLCHEARLRMVGDFWERDDTALAALADVLDDAKRDLERVQEEIEARQILAETP